MKTFGIVLFYAFLVTCVTVITVTVFKTKRVIAAACLSVFQGIASLFAVNFIGSFIGVHISMLSTKVKYLSTSSCLRKVIWWFGRCSDRRLRAVCLSISPYI